jgi:hypothetical protein
MPSLHSAGVRVDRSLAGETFNETPFIFFDILLVLSTGHFTQINYVN